MSELEVRIVKLEPMRVAWANGFGPEPESIAWDKIMAFIKSNNIEVKDHRFFGYNNPNPSPGSPNYGYDQWVTVGADAKATDDVKIKDFPGGLYAVTRCSLGNIGPTWKKLVEWRDDSKYMEAHHQWLENALNAEIFASDKADDADYIFANFSLDLYLPIVE
jgi:DNA gyrase inhibitor GyrI